MGSSSFLSSMLSENTQALKRLVSNENPPAAAAAAAVLAIHITRERDRNG